MYYLSIYRVGHVNLYIRNNVDRLYPIKSILLYKMCIISLFIECHISLFIDMKLSLRLGWCSVAATSTTAATTTTTTGVVIYYYYIYELHQLDLDTNGHRT